MADAGRLRTRLLAGSTVPRGSFGRCRYVRYIPMHLHADSKVAVWEKSPLPDVCVEYHNASCHICLEAFEEPRQGGVVSTAGMPEEGNSAIEPLIQLGCSHIFHPTCLAEYIQNTEDHPLRCAICRSKVQGDLRGLLAQHPYAPSPSRCSNRSLQQSFTSSRPYPQDSSMPTQRSSGIRASISALWRRVKRLVSHRRQ
ncbi:hypothetical protein OE88DRAFT_1659698 [Heliocybe sulcata]|uniref:RING-type domain-containing protein n=1 Tax=Heliocybe sulcata TaxID=5364 RepID=A0A5C3N541_9AGAM|nr:hypothetical protein OE88DRAFT_1659698 [Heliocybe sulcata]